MDDTHHIQSYVISNRGRIEWECGCVTAPDGTWDNSDCYGATHGGGGSLRSRCTRSPLEHPAYRAIETRLTSRSITKATSRAILEQQPGIVRAVFEQAWDELCRAGLLDGEITLRIETRGRAHCSATRSVGGGCHGYEDDRCLLSAGHDGDHRF